jgi:hypothetical protein
VRADGNKPEVNNLLLQNEVVKYEIEKNIQEQVETACCRIAECFGWEKPAERRVKPFNGI